MPDDEQTIVGDECHIVSGAAGGPRYDPEFKPEKLDDYSNLLLLCKVDHKLIDDRHLEYPAVRLREIKAEHENWVIDELDSSGSNRRPVKVRRIKENVPEYFPRICSGKQLFSIVTAACDCAADHDDFENDSEFGLVSNFLQDAQDIGELDLESASDLMRAARILDEHIDKLEQAGFWVFGYRERQIFEGGTDPGSDWPVAHIRVVRDSNPEVMILDDQAESQN